MSQHILNCSSCHLAISTHWMYYWIFPQNSEIKSHTRTWCKKINSVNKPHKKMCTWILICQYSTIYLWSHQFNLPSFFCHHVADMSHIDSSASWQLHSRMLDIHFHGCNQTIMIAHHNCFKNRIHIVLSNLFAHLSSDTLCYG